jgi:hypothetical protein
MGEIHYLGEARGRNSAIPDFKGATPKAAGSKQHAIFFGSRGRREAHLLTGIGVNRKKNIRGTGNPLLSGVFPLQDPGGHQPGR